SGARVAEVRRDPLADRLRLADVEHAAGGVPEQVHAGLVGELAAAVSRRYGHGEIAGSESIGSGAFGERAGRRGWEATRSSATRADRRRRIREVISDTCAASDWDPVIQPMLRGVRCGFAAVWGASKAAV